MDNKYELTADGSRAFVPVVELHALHVDAQRYRAMRLALCEPDKDVQARMLEAVDNLMESHGEIEQDKVTPELVDMLVDKILLAVAEARK